MGSWVMTKICLILAIWWLFWIMIFRKSNRTTEEEIWDLCWKESFNLLRAYEAHLQRYYWREDLRYYRILNSDPECYEYMWSPTAHAKNNNEVLEFFFFNRVHATVFMTLPFLICRGCKRWGREIPSQNCSQGWLFPRASAHDRTKYIDLVMNLSIWHKNITIRENNR